MCQEKSVRAEGVIQLSDYVRSQYLHIRPRPVFAVIDFLILALSVCALVAYPSWIMAGAAVALVLWQYKALAEPMTIEVRDDGLFFKRINGEGLVPWSEIVKWRQNDKLLLLYPANNVFHLVPRHFFTTQEAYAEFVEVLKARCGNAT
jgi:hypothetical protein